MIQDSNFVREFNKFTKYEHQDEMNKIGCDIKIRLRDALDYLTGKRMGEYPQTFKLKRNHWFPLYFHLNNIEKMFYSSYDQQYKNWKHYFEFYGVQILIKNFLSERLQLSRR